MSARRILVCALTLAGLTIARANAGGYLFVAGKIREADPNQPGNAGPYMIVHPPGWAGQSGTFTVRLCVQPGSEPLIPPLDWAIQTWNRRLPKHPNCRDCVTWEDGGGPGATVNVASVLLHEVGHCIGLGHPNHHEPITDIASQPWRTGTCDADSDGSCGDRISFTDVGMATEILVGTDGIRGSRDDTPLNQCGFIAPPGPGGIGVLEFAETDPEILAKAGCLAAFSPDPLGLAVKAACSGHVQCCPPCPGSACPTAPMAMQHLAWFRQVDNNPFARDGVVIDRNTFTRNANLLPAGSSYAASGNRHVAAALGYAGSQAVMYSGLGTGQGFNGLTADDVNMVRMAMTGVDRFANSPAPPDDYVLVLERVADCALAHIEVFADPTLPSGDLGGCDADTAPSPSVPPVFGLILHYTVKAHSPLPKPIIGVNTTTVPVDFLIPLPLIDFETGDLSEWSGSAP